MTNLILKIEISVFYILGLNILFYTIVNYSVTDYEFSPCIITTILMNLVKLVPGIIGVYSNHSMVYLLLYMLLM